MDVTPTFGVRYRGVKLKEFSIQESGNYDIISSLNHGDNSNNSYNTYSEQLMDLIGILEDVTKRITTRKIWY